MPRLIVNLNSISPNLKLSPDDVNIVCNGAAAYLEGLPTGFKKGLAVTKLEFKDHQKKKRFVDWNVHSVNDNRISINITKVV